VEFSWIRKKAMTVLINELIEKYDNYSECSLLENNELDYIKNWYKVLSEYLNE